MSDIYEFGCDGTPRKIKAYQDYDYCNDDGTIETYTDYIYNCDECDERYICKDSVYYTGETNE